jgi:hypothetical protein
MTEAQRAIEAFWHRVERMRVEDMLALAARPIDENAHAAVMQRAADAADRAGLAQTIEDARRSIDDWVIHIYNASTVQPGWLEANWGRPGSSQDRANLAASLGEVVRALVLGNRISDDDRDELLGAWAELAG